MKKYIKAAAACNAVYVAKSATLWQNTGSCSGWNAINGATCAVYGDWCGGQACISATEGNGQDIAFIKYVSTKGYDDVRIQYDVYPEFEGKSNGEACYVRYSNNGGGSWVQGAKLTAESYTTGLQVDCNSAADDNTNFRVMFSTDDTKDSNDYCSWDNMKVLGNLIPTPQPTNKPTPKPTPNPTRIPTPNPTPSPTANPTPSPTANPTPSPTDNPTISPTKNPTSPTDNPTQHPSNNPTKSPTKSPTNDPTNPTINPTIYPSVTPSKNPTKNPTHNPTDITTDPTSNPSFDPTTDPTYNPTTDPTPRSGAVDVTDVKNTRNNNQDNDNLKADNVTSNVPMLIGIIAAITACLLCLLGLIYYIKRKKRISKLKDTMDYTGNISKVASVSQFDTVDNWETSPKTQEMNTMMSPMVELQSASIQNNIYGMHDANIVNTNETQHDSDEDILNDINGHDHVTAGGPMDLLADMMMDTGDAEIRTVGSEGGGGGFINKKGSQIVTKGQFIDDDDDFSSSDEDGIPTKVTRGFTPQRNNNYMDDIDNVENNNDEIGLEEGTGVVDDDDDILNQVQFITPNGDELGQNIIIDEEENMIIHGDDETDDILNDVTIEGNDNDDDILDDIDNVDNYVTLQ